MAYEVVGRLDVESTTDFGGDAESGLALELDLRRVSFASPAGLIALCVKAESVIANGNTVLVRSPSDPSVANYIARAHLPAQLEAIGIAHDFAPVQENHLGLRLVEIQRFENAGMVEVLAQSVYAFAEPISSAIAGQLHVAVCEAGENVTFHSDTSYGYLMAQYFPGNRTFEFALGDSGVGFLGSLASRGAANNHEAIALAVTPGVSATGDPGRGYGLSSIRTSLADAGGALTLYSGTSYQYFASASGACQAKGSFVGRLDGSLIKGRLRTI
jgi:hypothetical protein